MKSSIFISCLGISTSTIPTPTIISLMKKTLAILIYYLKDLKNKKSIKNQFLNDTKPANQEFKGPQNKYHGTLTTHTVTISEKAISHIFLIDNSSDMTEYWLDSVEMSRQNNSETMSTFLTSRLEAQNL